MLKVIVFGAWTLVSIMFFQSFEKDACGREASTVTKIAYSAVAPVGLSLDILKKLANDPFGDDVEIKKTCVSDQKE